MLEINVIGATKLHIFMDKLYADLHVHTKYSDGTFSPAESVNYAKKSGLAAISITDHDTTDGIAEAIAEGLNTGVEVIPGVELSAEPKNVNSQEMHILGYFMNWQNESFQQQLKIFKEAREKRAFQILEKLKNMGIALDEQKLLNIKKVSVIGRLHIAKMLIEQNVVSNTYQAFRKYLGYGKPAYVPKFRLAPNEAIKMILQVGGIPVLAHPHCNNVDHDVVKSLVDSGLKGIEVWHTKHTPEETNKFRKMAIKFGLIMTGGSDCHGEVNNAAPIMGTVKVPYDVVSQLKELKNNPPLAV